ncbi:hypothetical protein B0H12DRAFT_1220454 [Mycena haematopus]|nr:hypothetical protein B0H12DRAFT_1220454 [Mycena haematopus]
MTFPKKAYLIMMARALLASVSGHKQTLYSSRDLAMDLSPELPAYSPGTKKCNKSFCKRITPIGQNNCDICLENNRNAQRKKRQAAKAHNTDTTTSRKRRASSVDSTDGRPTARPRTSLSSEDRIHTRGNAEEDAQSDDDMRGYDREDDIDQGAETFPDAESFCDALRAEFKNGKPVDFHGTYPIPVDSMLPPRTRVEMVARELWKLSGFRFTCVSVKDHRKLKSGHHTRYWCSQDDKRKKKSKASQNPEIRNRDTLGMKRFPCQSKLSISCRAQKDNEDLLDVTVRVKHADKHVSYEDVALPPAALAMIRDNVEWLTPVAMVTKVQAAFPQVTAAQIHRAWTEMSEPFWRFDRDQLSSTKILLQEHTSDIDIFEPQDIPEGVDMICWGMKKIATPLKGKIVEIGVDATYQGKRTRALTAWAKCVRDIYGINAKFTHVDKDMAEIKMLKDVWDAKISLCWWHLRRAVRTRLANTKLETTPYDAHRAHGEFSFIDVAFVPLGQADGGEYEGGAPEAITPVVPPSQHPVTVMMSNGLRITIRAPGRQALTTVGANGQVQSHITSTDEGPAPQPPEDTEIESAVAACIESTTDKRAGQQNVPSPPEGCVETGTVPMLAPRTRASKPLSRGKENENIDTHDVDVRTTRRGRIVKPTRASDAADPAVLARAMNARTTGPVVSTVKKAKAKGAGEADMAAAESKVPDNTADAAAATSGSEDEEEEGEGKKRTRRTFCPAIYRERIVSMMEKHYCAHPLLPGYAHPSPEGIRRWAVLQMYKFCVEAGLREVWAYLWENWYRSSRWELWARSVNPEIPVLKTTMILESHWRRIKHDFLHHFHMPRCDLLAWILIVKLAPTFYRKLDRLLTDTGRYRELSSWRKNFKRTWRRLEKTPITLPVDPAYKTDAKRMICTCPSLAVSRFLLCKHVVQAFDPVPPVFFLEVKRQRTAPFWIHPSLQLLLDAWAPAQASEDVIGDMTRVNSAADATLDSDDEDDDGMVDTQPDGDLRTFVEAMDEEIDPAKPGPLRPGQAKPDSRLGGALGLGFKNLKPGRALKPGPTYLGWHKAPSSSKARAQAQARPGQALFEGLGLGLQNPEPEPTQARPKPGLSGQARPWASLVILEFTKGLKFQRQFRDQRMLQALQREGASFLRLARACLGKEKRLRSTRGSTPSTWDKSVGSAMFYRARPTASAE